MLFNPKSNLGTCISHTFYFRRVQVYGTYWLLLAYKIKMRDIPCKNKDFVAKYRIITYLLYCRAVYYTYSCQSLHVKISLVRASVLR